MDEMRAALPLLLLPLFAACAPAEKTQTQTASTTESLAAGRDAGPAVQVSPPQPSALEALEASADMHYDLGALAHFAVCGHELGLWTPSSSRRS